LFFIGTSFASDEKENPVAFVVVVVEGTHTCTTISKKKYKSKKLRFDPN
jgi:hypothetical protein